MHKNGWDEEVQDIIVCKIDIYIYTHADVPIGTPRQGD